MTHKYRSQRTEYNGRSYASKAEAARAAELDLLKSAGEIRGWTPQVKFELGCPENKYYVDFLMFGIKTVWAEDVKGFETKAFKRNKSLWRKYAPCQLHILKRTGAGWDKEIVV